MSACISSTTARHLSSATSKQLNAIPGVGPRWQQLVVAGIADAKAFAAFVASRR
jgi:hypothetical protein